MVIRKRVQPLLFLRSICQRPSHIIEIIMKSAASEAIASVNDHGIFKALMENVSEAVFVIEPGALRVLDANRNAAARLGYSTEEILALKADRIFPDCANLLQDVAGVEAPVTENRLLAKVGLARTCALTLRQIL